MSYGRTLVQLLAEARRAKGWSQDDLAERAGIKIDTIRKIEQGQTLSPTVFTVVRLATALDLDLNALRAADLPSNH